MFGVGRPMSYGSTSGAAFIDDPVGLANLDIIGVGRILWESDYPHADSLWPHSRTNAKKVFSDLLTDIVR
jgi:hypothetical protein